MPTNHTGYSIENFSSYPRMDHSLGQTPATCIGASLQFLYIYIKKKQPSFGRLDSSDLAQEQLVLVADTISRIFTGLFSYSVLQKQVEGQHLGTSSWHPGNAAVSGKSPRRLSPAAKGGDGATDGTSKTLKWSFVFCRFPPLPSPAGAKGRHVNPAPASGNCYLQVPTVCYCFSYFFFFTNSVRRLQTSSSPRRRAARQRSEIKLIQKKKKM